MANVIKVFLQKSKRLYENTSISAAIDEICSFLPSPGRIHYYLRKDVLDLITMHLEFILWHDLQLTLTSCFVLLIVFFYSFWDKPVRKSLGFALKRIAAQGITNLAGKSCKGIERKGWPISVGLQKALVDILCILDEERKNVFCPTWRFPVFSLLYSVDCHSHCSHNVLSHHKSFSTLRNTSSITSFLASRDCTMF